MTEEARQFWTHARTALNTARRDLKADPAAAANRAYYAAFYAVSALFASEGKTFRKHSAVEAAIHRDLVNTGQWSHNLGAAFRELRMLRTVADYDVSAFPSVETVQEAVRLAGLILEAVLTTYPELDRAGDA